MTGVSPCEFTATSHAEFAIAVQSAEVGDLILVVGGYVIPTGLPVRLSGAGVWLKTSSEENE